MFDSERDGYEATMKLAKEHPELLPKLKKLFELSRFGVFSSEELAGIGITRDEITIFESYGLIRKGNIIEERF